MPSTRPMTMNVVRRLAGIGVPYRDTAGAPPQITGSLSSHKANHSSHESQQQRTEDDPIPREQREAMRLHVTQQPLDRDERDDGRDDEANGKVAPALLRLLAVLVNLKSLVRGGGKHGGNGNDEGEVRSGAPRSHAREHCCKYGGGGPRRAGKHRRDNLPNAHPERYAPRELFIDRLPLGIGF